MANISDEISWKANWRIDRFKDPDGKIAEMLQAGALMEDVIKKFGEEYLGCEEWEKNVALNIGLQYLIDVICGIGSTTKWDNTNARLGVGSDATAPDPTQTDLIDGTPTWKAMDGTYPQISGQVAEWRSTFADGEAEEAWEEYGVDNGAAAHKVLNRCTASKGTKGSGESWTLSLKITFS